MLPATGLIQISANINKQYIGENSVPKYSTVKNKMSKYERDLLVNMRHNTSQHMKESIIDRNNAITQQN